MFNFAMVLLFVFSEPGSSAVRQSKPMIITEDSVSVIGYAELKIESRGSVIWRITPLPIKKTLIGNTLIFSGIPEKIYEVEALVIDWDTKAVHQDFKRIKFSQIVDPDNPPIIPPAIEEQLIKDMRTAIASDPDSSLIPKFVDMYSKLLETGTGVIDKATTYGGFEEGMKAEAMKLGLSGKAIAYQTVAAKYARDNLPWQKSSDTPIDKVLVKKVFSKLKSSLEQALRSSK